MDALMKRIDENITTTAPPSPDTATSCTMMEEMMLQLSVMQYDIQEMLREDMKNSGARQTTTSM
jgi:hypothetical protein